MVRYVIDVDRETWEEFKALIAKNKNINEEIVELIEDKIRKATFKEAENE